MIPPTLQIAEALRRERGLPDHGDPTMAFLVLVGGALLIGMGTVAGLLL